MAVSTGMALATAIGAGVAKKGIDKLAGGDKAQKAREAASSGKTLALPKLPGYTNDMGIPEIPMTYLTKDSTPVVDKPTLAPPSAGELGQGRSLDAAGAAFRSLLEPANPQMQDLTNAEAQLSRIDFLRGLRDVMTQNRRSMAQGRGSVFGNDRMDENVARMIMENAQTSEAGARTRAMDRMRGYGNDMGQLASGYGSYAGTERNRTNDYLDQYNRYIDQLRNDKYARVGQKREDQRLYLNTINKRAPTMMEGRADAAASKYAGNMAIAEPFLGALNMGMSGMTGGLF